MTQNYYILTYDKPSDLLWSTMHLTSWQSAGNTWIKVSTFYPLKAWKKFFLTLKIPSETYLNTSTLPCSTNKFILISLYRKLHKVSNIAFRIVLFTQIISISSQVDHCFLFISYLICIIFKHNFYTPMPLFIFCQLDNSRADGPYIIVYFWSGVLSLICSGLNVVCPRLLFPKNIRYVFYFNWKSHFS